MKQTLTPYMTAVLLHLHDGRASGVPSNHYLQALKALQRRGLATTTPVDASGCIRNVLTDAGQALAILNA